MINYLDNLKWFIAGPVNNKSGPVNNKSSHVNNKSSSKKSNYHNTVIFSDVNSESDLEYDKIIVKNNLENHNKNHSSLVKEDKSKIHILDSYLENYSNLINHDDDDEDENKILNLETIDTIQIYNQEYLNSNTNIIENLFTNINDKKLTDCENTINDKKLTDYENTINDKITDCENNIKINKNIYNENKLSIENKIYQVDTKLEDIILSMDNLFTNINDKLIDCENNIKTNENIYNENKLEIENKIYQVDTKIEDIIISIDKINTKTDKYLFEIEQLKNIINENKVYIDEIIQKIKKFNKEYNKKKNTNQFLNFFNNFQKHMILSKFNDNNYWYYYIGYGFLGIWVVCIIKKIIVSKK